MPLNTNIGGQLKPNRSGEGYLTEEQAKHMYKKVELGNVVNISALKQETDQDRELNRLYDTSRDNNPYRELIVNNAEGVDTILSQTQYKRAVTDFRHLNVRSTLSNVVNYIQYIRYLKNFHNLNIKAVNKVNHRRKPNTEEERQIIELNFGDMPGKLRGENIDIYDGIQSEILSTTRFDENSDLSTTCLGRVNTTRASKVKAEETFTISEQGYKVENYWMDQNVRYYWIQELANHLCLNHTICIVNHFIFYQSLHLKCRKFK